MTGEIHRLLLELKQVVPVGHGLRRLGVLDLAEVAHAVRVFAFVAVEAQGA